MFYPFWLFWWQKRKCHYFHLCSACYPLTWFSQLSRGRDSARLSWCLSGSWTSRLSSALLDDFSASGGRFLYNTRDDSRCPSMFVTELLHLFTEDFYTLGAVYLKCQDCILLLSAFPQQGKWFGFPWHCKNTSTSFTALMWDVRAVDD